MGIYKDFKTDVDAEINGIRVETSVNDDGTIATFILARSGRSNKMYQKCLEVEMRPYKRQIELGTLNDDIAQRMLLSVFAKSVLKGWENVEDENGNKLEFTHANICKVMTDLPDLYLELTTRANEASNFKQSILEEEVKN